MKIRKTKEMRVKSRTDTIFVLREIAGRDYKNEEKSKQ